MRYRYYGYPVGMPYDKARAKHTQAMRTESCKVTGSRWNRPCPLMDACMPGTPCICDLPRIVTMRSRCCNRVACSFLKWCHAEPEQDWRPNGWRLVWADAIFPKKGIHYETGGDYSL